MSSYNKPGKKKKEEPERNDGDPEKQSTGVVSSLVDELVQRYEKANTSKTKNKSGANKWTKSPATAISTNGSSSSKNTSKQPPGRLGSTTSHRKPPTRQRSASDSDDHIGFFDESDDDDMALVDGKGDSKPATTSASERDSRNVVEDYTRRVTIETTVPENVMDMWGDKVKAIKPGDPSRLTHRQRMSQADKVKERIERAKATKRKQQQQLRRNASKEQNESDLSKNVQTAESNSMDDDAAAMFFGAASGRKETTEPQSPTNAESAVFSVPSATNVGKTEKPTAEGPREKIVSENADGTLQKDRLQPDAAFVSPTPQKDAISLVSPLLTPTGDGRNDSVYSVKEAVSASERTTSTTSPGKLMRESTQNMSDKDGNKRVNRKDDSSSSSLASASSSTGSGSGTSKDKPHMIASPKTTPKSSPISKKTPSRDKNEISSSSSDSSSSSSTSSGSSSSSSSAASTKKKPSKPDPTTTSTDKVVAETDGGTSNDAEAKRRQKELEDRLKSLKELGPSKAPKARPSSLARKRSSDSSSSSSSGRSSSSSSSGSSSSSVSSSSSSATSPSSASAQRRKKTEPAKQVPPTKNAAEKKAATNINHEKKAEKETMPEKDDNDEEVRALHRDLQTLGIAPEILVHREEEKPVSSFSVGEDSYLADLLQQRIDREHVRQEELMEDAVEMYRAAVAKGAPESEALYLQFLEELKKERAKEDQEKDKVQDELIAKETARLKSLKKKGGSAETEPEEHQSPISKMQQKQKAKAEAQAKAEKEKQDRKNAILASVDDVLEGNIEAELVVEPPLEETTEEDIEFETDSENSETGTSSKKVDSAALGFPDAAAAISPTRSRQKDRASPSKRSPGKVSSKRSPKRKRHEKSPGQKTPLHNDIPETVSVPSCDEDDEFYLDLQDEALGTVRKKRQKANKKNKKQKKRKRSAKRKRRRPVVEDDSESDDWDSSSSASSFDSYDSTGDRQDQLTLDLAAAESSGREAAMTVMEAKQTRTRMIAATLICMVAFGLLFFFVLDPLGRRDDGEPFRDVNGQQRRLLRGCKGNIVLIMYNT